MTSIRDSSETFSTLSSIKVFDKPQSLAEYVAKQCSLQQESAPFQTNPPSLLHYDVALIDGKEYLMAILADGWQQTWLFSELKRRQALPSLAGSWPALLWTERELAQKTQRPMPHHPDLAPLRQPHEYQLQPRASGSGVFSLPLGPVRADVTESAFFLFETVGEQIMHMQPQLFYKHRNIEGMAVGKEVEDALFLAERISGTSCASHAAAFVRAVEQAMELTPSRRAELERMLFVEMERLYNHAGDLSQMASAAGMTVGQAQLARVKEEILRLNGDLTSSRYLHGAIHVDGSTSILWAQWADEMEQRLRDMDTRFNHFVRLLLRTPTFVDRLIGTGIVNPDWARQYQLVGPVARACGVATDARVNERAMDDYGYEIATAKQPVGDAKDRFDIRISEWNVSVAMVFHLLRDLRDLPDSELSSPIPNGEVHPNDKGAGWGVGVCEGPRGRIAHVVYTNHNKIEYLGVRSASFWNWPIFGLATANGNIQTDFPVIDASFGLSCAGIDR